jgi:hypothetical protein
MMPTNNLWAGVLSQLLIHQETGCPHSARHAIRLLDQLCEFADLDADVRALCERASQRLEQPLTTVRHAAKERCHARPA